MVRSPLASCAPEACVPKTSGGEHLPRMLFQIRHDQLNEGRTKICELLITHAADAPELCFRSWVIPRHLPQRHVRENDVSRHTTLICNLLSQPAQFVEQRLVIV